MRVRTHGKDLAIVQGYFWDRNMSPIVRRIRASLAPGLAREILRQFAGLKAVSIADPERTAFYNAAGEHLFTVPPLEKGE